MHIEAEKLHVAWRRLGRLITYKFISWLSCVENSLGVLPLFSVLVITVASDNDHLIYPVCKSELMTVTEGLWNKDWCFTSSSGTVLLYL